MQISSELEPSWKLHWEKEERLFLNTIDVPFWQTHELHCHYISAQVFVVKHADQEVDTLCPSVF